MTTEIDKSQWYRFIKRFKSFQQGREKRIEEGLSNSAELVLRRAKTHYLTGAALRVQTGRLRSSVTKQPATGARKTGKSYSVDVGTNVWYGRAWELGFTIKPYTIVPRVKKALRFEVGGKTIFAKKVSIPGRTVKPRKWLEPAIKDNMTNIEKILTKAGVVFE